MATKKSGFVLQKGRKWEAEIRRLKTTPEKIEKVVRDELITMAVGIRNHIIRSMRSTPRKIRINSKTGNPYGRLAKNGRSFHIPSSPGYAPAVDTGDLIKSIKMDVRSNEVEVGSNLTGKTGKYPAFLEFGTKKMAARPWLEPAFIDEKREFLSTIRVNIINAIRKAR